MPIASKSCRIASHHNQREDVQETIRRSASWHPGIPSLSRLRRWASGDKAKTLRNVRIDHLWLSHRKGHRGQPVLHSDSMSLKADSMPTPDLKQIHKRKSQCSAKPARTLQDIRQATASAGASQFTPERSACQLHFGIPLQRSLF